MARVLIDDLKGAQLDWAVSFCEGTNVTEKSIIKLKDLFERMHVEFGFKLNYSNNVLLAYKIIDRDKYEIRFEKDYSGRPGNDVWVAKKQVGKTVSRVATGKTLIEACMRCRVATKFRQSIEIPDALLDVSVSSYKKQSVSA